MEKPQIVVNTEPGGRLLVEVRRRDGELERINQNDKIVDSEPGTPLVAGLAHAFSLLNYHFSDTYLVSVENGTVTSMDYPALYITPEAEGECAITINGTTQFFHVVANRPDTPTILYPENNTLNLPVNFEIHTSEFSAPNPYMEHYATRWQVATDPEFQTIAYDVTSTTDKIQTVTSGLKNNIQYYIRAYHIGQS